MRICSYCKVDPIRRIVNPLTHICCNCGRKNP